jgi:sulfoxide reductase heme-binding subunit YedZ
MAKKLGWLQPAILVGSLVPFAVLAVRVLGHSLGANPVATVLNRLGLLALIFLLASLACTPLKLVFRWTWPMRVRKTLGLFGFFTALSHFVVYFVVDHGLALRAVLADVAKRPFIAVGFAALLLLVPVALTSTTRSPKRLGYARWKRIHQLVYVIGVLGVVHFYLRVKADTREPLVYAALLGALFAVRLVDVARRRSARRHVGLADS